MEYILIDNFNGYINIVCTDDGRGDVLMFDNITDAKACMQEYCQDGIIVPLSGSLELLEKINELLHSGKLVLKEETEEDKANFIKLKKEIEQLF